jgi:ComF family protein
VQTSILRSPVALRRAARELLRAAFDLILPPGCPVCDRVADGLCQLCDQQLTRRPRQGCRRCGEAALPGQDVCGDEHRELAHLRHLVAPWRFAGTGGALVRRFKLDGHPLAGRWLARAIADAWRQQLAPTWRRALLVPVPLHAARRRRRGFDQAALLASWVGARIGCDHDPAVLARMRPTLPQGDPRVLSRADNVAGAFVVRHPGRIAGRAVVLLDDVFTSGATLRQCAAALKAAGAGAIAAVVACRS